MAGHFFVRKKPTLFALAGEDSGNAVGDQDNTEANKDENQVVAIMLMFDVEISNCFQYFLNPSPSGLFSQASVSTVSEPLLRRIFQVSSIMHSADSNFQSVPVSRGALTSVAVTVTDLFSKISIYPLQLKMQRDW